MEVRYHPLFERWLTELADADEEVFGEVMALLSALEVHGRGLDDETQEESHPVVTARHDMRMRSAARRPPKRLHSPRNHRCCECYAYCTDGAGEEIAVALLGGDKTRLGNLWYPPNVIEAGNRLDQYCRRHTDLKAIMKRGSR